MLQAPKRRNRVSPLQRWPRRRRRTGWGVLELVVGLTVIGLLLALLIPVLQQARESARRTVCAHHLRQQVLSVHAYHDSHGRLPYGVYGGWGYDLHAALLPFLDQPDLAQAVLASDAGFWNGRDARSQALVRLARTPLATHQCPAQAVGPIETRRLNGIAGRAISSYNGNGGSDVWRGDNLYERDTDLADSNGPFRVALMKRGSTSELDLGSIRDGLSQTVFLGEVRYRVDDVCSVCDRFRYYHPHFDIEQGFDFSESLSSMYFRPNPPETGPERSRVEPNQELAFGSFHPGGLNVALGDGSVRWIEDAISLETWRALGSRASQDVVQPAVEERPSSRFPRARRPSLTPTPDWNLPAGPRSPSLNRCRLR